MYTSNGELYPLEWCDFELHQHGENGTPPTDHSFSFKAGKDTTNSDIQIEYRAINNCVTRTR